MSTRTVLIVVTLVASVAAGARTASAQDPSGPSLSMQKLGVTFGPSVLLPGPAAARPGRLAGQLKPSLPEIVDVTQRGPLLAAAPTDCAMPVLAADPSLDPKMPRPAGSTTTLSMRTMPAPVCPKQ